MDPIPLVNEPERDGPRAEGENFVSRLREATEWAQAAMAAAQEEQEKQANKSRKP